MFTPRVRRKATRLRLKSFLSFMVPS
ncbi:hypothetical protein RHCRD62_10312 [Rhodococcus sp. RD6.2]|nr:hypothetical protein RHCRD62_10312 [Rhodococcus sp. RD6.2]